MGVPVGNYYKGGPKATTAVVMEDYDRAAPKGVGHVKVGTVSVAWRPGFRIEYGRNGCTPGRIHDDAQWDAPPSSRCGTTLGNASMVVHRKKSNCRNEF